MLQVVVVYTINQPRPRLFSLLCQRWLESVFPTLSILPMGGGELVVVGPTVNFGQPDAVTTYPRRIRCWGDTYARRYRGLCDVQHVCVGMVLILSKSDVSLDVNV